MSVAVQLQYVQLITDKTDIANLSSGVFSALEVFLNVMRYINPRFTYLLTSQF